MEKAPLDTELTPAAESAPTGAATNALPPEAAAAAVQKLLAEQNLIMALLAGAFAAVASAFIWAIIGVASGYEIGWVAIGVGFLTGWGVRTFGRGVTKTYGIIGASLALFALVLGKILLVIGMVAQEFEAGYLEAIQMIDWALLPQILSETFAPMDLLFYGLALYAGYKYSFRVVDNL